MGEILKGGFSGGNWLFKNEKSLWLAPAFILKIVNVFEVFNRFDIKVERFDCRYIVYYLPIKEKTLLKI